MRAGLFIVFHQGIDLRLIFPCFCEEEISSLVRLYAVAERYPEKWAILKDGREYPARDVPLTVFEQDLPLYDPQLQTRGFMETSAYIHILKNDLHQGLSHIGISQYDVCWTEQGVARMREVMTASSPTVGAIVTGRLMDGAGNWHRLAYAQAFNWDFLLESYNRQFGTQWTLADLAGLPMALYQTYVLPQQEFIALAGWLAKLCDEVWPWANQPPYPKHWGFLGGYTERAEALFIALGYHEGRFRLCHMPLEHDRRIIKLLGLRNSHYG